MCGVASDVASGMLPVATPAAATEDASDESSSTSCVNNPDNDGDIVMVVGSAHISGAFGGRICMFSIFPSIPFINGPVVLALRLSYPSTSYLEK